MEMVNRLAPYAGSPSSVISKMLDIAKPKKHDLLVDIGSGKGNIVIEAAKKNGIRSVGVEADSALVKESRARVRKEMLQDRIKIVHADAFGFDITNADIVTLYLTGSGMRRIESKIFTEAKNGARIVSHDYKFSHHKPKKQFPFIGISAYAPWWLPFPSLHWIFLYAR